MKKFFPFLILFSLIFVSCKEKTNDFIFTWAGTFSHKFLVASIDNPEELFPEEKNNSNPEPVIGNEPIDEFEFYGIDIKQMGEIIKSFGDCKLNLEVTFTVETNGLSIKKIYINEGSELFFDFSCQNELPEIVLETADKMIKDYPVHKLKYGADNKSFYYYCKYPETYVLFDSDVVGEEIDLGKMEKPKKQDGIKFKIKDGKAVITASDKNYGVDMTMTIGKAKEGK